MAVTPEGSSTNYKGLSTDTKPTEGVEINALFLELDTYAFYFWDGEAWQLVGGEA